jgi:uncharacterized membrane protein
MAVDSADLAAAAEVLAAAVLDRVGNRMRTKEFVSKLEHDRIVQAIRDAESKTSAQIRIYIQRGKLEGDPLEAATRRFHRLGMHNSKQHASVLIFVAPRAHKFAVVGDEAIHQKCGEPLWQRICDLMRNHFRNERFTDALVDAINDIGRVLAGHFPKKRGDLNELPDQIGEN